MSRRSLLRLGAGCVGALAGCSGLQSGGSISGRADRSTPWSPPEDWCAAGGSDALRDGRSGLRTGFDARAAFRCLGDPVDDMEDLGRWTVTGGTLTADGDSYATGTQSAHVRAAADADRVSIRRPLPGGFDMSDRNPSLAIHCSDSAPLSVYVQLLAPDGDNRMDLWQVAGLGGWNRLDPGPTGIVGNPNLTDVRGIGASVWTGDGSPDFRIDSVRTTDKPDEGRVLFTFDDNRASQYDVAFPVLEQYDVPGTIATTPDAVGLDGRTTLDQLRELDLAGWDVVNHPPADDPLPELPRWQQRSAMRETKRWLLDHGFDSGAPFVVWPYGAAGAGTLDVATDYYSLGFTGGRSTTAVPVTDPLTVNRVDGRDVERTKRLLELAAEYRTLAVPRYPGSDDDFSARRDYVGDLREVLDHADRLGLSAITTSDLWDEMLP